MLVLSRKYGEEVIIGDNVHITVVAVQGNRVKLGITAPPDVVIRRAELDDGTKSSAGAITEVHGDLPQVGVVVGCPS